MTISDAVIASIGDDVCELTLGGSAGAWTFYDAVEGGYLYAASSSSNYLRTQPTNDSNGEWSITIGADGAATMTAQGGNTRNRLKYNSQNNIFSCYSGDNTSNTILEVSLFRRVEGGNVIEQSYEFTDGWNWWAPNINIALADFQNSLGSDGIQIIDQNDNTNTYNATYGWGGSLSELVVGKMYMVRTTRACSVTVSGTIVDPIDYPITIKHGNNWVGFIGTQEMTLDQALINFTPSNLDVIKINNNTATYYNNKGWKGSVTHLVPGQGFIYKSKSTTNKTFCFPAQ